MYKLIAIDMDGTLLNDHHEVTEEVRDALHAAKAEGVKIVLCTGRPIGGVQRYLDELNLIGVYKLDESKKCIGVFSSKLRSYNEVKSS